MISCKKTISRRMLKKLVALFMVLAMCFSLCACETDDATNADSVEDVIKGKVEMTIYTKVYLEYGYHPTISVTYIRERDDNVYDVSGRVTVSDKYGDPYSGTFDAVAKYDPTDKSASVSSYDVSKLYKD